MQGSTPRLTARQWLVCVVAGGGFAFDLYETLMLPLILRPALADLGHLTGGTRAFNIWSGLLLFIPSASAGLVALLGGYLTDLVGRRRVLIASILLYGVSAIAASECSSLTQLLLLRCITLSGIYVEYIAGVAWIAELFEQPRQRELALGYTQACFNLGGLMVTGTYLLAVLYSDRWPVIHGGHAAWRYTLLSGAIPALPLMLVRPWLPESPLWQAKKAAGTLQRPSLLQLFKPSLRRVTLITTLLAACSFALAYGAIQQTLQIVHELPQVRALAPRLAEKTVSMVQLVQEVGGIAGRMLLVGLIIRVATQGSLLRALLVGSLLAFAWTYFVAATGGVMQIGIGIFLAALLFNALHSFWGNCLPRLFPTHLRGTGESLALNVGGRVLGVSAALLTTQLANVLPSAHAGVRLAYAAGAVAVLACLLGLIASRALPEPVGEQLPD